MQKVRQLHSIFYFVKILAFTLSAFQQNAQPSPLVMILGGGGNGEECTWGYLFKRTG